MYKRQVIQGGLNKQIAGQWGLSSTLLVNNFLILLASIAIYYGCKVFPEVWSEQLLPRGSFAAFRWWYFIPALCGLIIIAGIPLLIPKIGASGVFLALIVGQLIFSIIWDLFVEKIPIPTTRYVGALLTFLGLGLSFWKGA